MDHRASIQGTIFLGLALSLAPSLFSQETPFFRRGDANGSGALDISDAVYVLNFLFNGGPAPPCLPVANANGTDDLDISDAVAILSFLFGGLDSLPELTEAETENCESPPEPTVLRHGTFLNVTEPSHEISGRVEQMSDGTIRITDFYFDGEGVPKVVVFLQEVNWSDSLGCVISEDLLRGSAYVDVDMTYTIPTGDLKCDTFRYVTIYCDFFPQTYAYSRMYDGPFP